MPARFLIILYFSFFLFWKLSTPWRAFYSYLNRRHDAQLNDTWQNDTQHNNKKIPHHMKLNANAKCYYMFVIILLIVMAFP